jgi:hypothetical protein
MTGLPVMYAGVLSQVPSKEQADEEADMTIVEIKAFAPASGFTRSKAFYDGFELVCASDDLVGRSAA